MNNVWKGSLTIALVLVLGTTEVGRADCTCGACSLASSDLCGSGCGNSCDNACDNGCGNGSCFIYKDACSSLEATDNGYLWTLGQGRCAKRFRFDGWVEAGIMTNSHGTTRSDGGANYGGNGPMHVTGNRRNDVVLQQIYMYGEKELDASNGFDWGFRTDFLYGNDAEAAQSVGDRSFDYDWGSNRHGYGLSCYQLMGSVGYKNLTVRGGKFITPIGWEGVAAKDNFFYSHSYCYWIEPSTHTGILGDFAVNDRLTVTGGWTTGINNGFKNRFDDSGYIAGLSYALTSKTNLIYYVTQGDTNNGQYNTGEWVFGIPDVDKSKYYIQSFVFEWKPTNCFTYVMQYNLRNDSCHFNNGAPIERTSAYGINNHFLYQLTNKVGVGARVEWLRDNGTNIINDPANYFGITYGLNWNPNRHWSVRPEVRFDWADNGKPFADGEKSSQATGGIGMLYIF